METNQEKTSSMSQREYVVKVIEKNNEYLNSSNVLLKILEVLSSIWIAIGTYFAHDSSNQKLFSLVSMVMILILKVTSIATANLIVDHQIIGNELEQKLVIDDLIKSEGVASAREYLIKNVNSAKSNSKAIKKMLSLVVTIASVVLTGYLHFYADTHILEAVLLMIGSLSLDVMTSQSRNVSALDDYIKRMQIDLELNTIKDKLELKRKKNN